MSWFKKPPKITDEEVQELKDKSEDIKSRATAIEQAVMDGEHQWMLIKCPPVGVPICKDDLPKQESLKPCTQT